MNTEMINALNAAQVIVRRFGESQRHKAKGTLTDVKVKKVFTRYGGKLICTLGQQDIANVFGPTFFDASQVIGIPDFILPWKFNPISGEIEFGIKVGDMTFIEALKDPEAQYGYKTEVNVMATIECMSYMDFPTAGIKGCTMKLVSPLIILQ